MSHVLHAPDLIAADAELAAELERILRGDSPPAVLLPYQQHWIADTARVRIFEKSRRIGITWASAGDCVLEAGGGTQDVWYVAYSEDGAKEFIRDCAEWCERLGLAASSLVVEINEEDDDTPAAPAYAKLLDWDEEGQKGVRALQIRFPSGKRVTALTSNPRNLRGKQGRVIIDEAAFHTDLDELLKAAFALMMWGGEVWILSTHNGVDNPFAVLCDQVRDGKKPYSLHRCTIVEAIEQGLYQRICTDAFVRNGEVKDSSPDGEKAWLDALVDEYGDGAEEELFCTPAGSGQSYIGHALIASCEYEAPVIRYEQDDSWCAKTEAERVEEMDEWLSAELGPLLAQLEGDTGYRAFGFGLDFARSCDLTVAAPIGIRQNMVRRVPFMLEMRNVPFNQQYQAVAYILKGLPHLMFSCLDAGGNGSWVAEQVWLNFGGDEHVERVMLSQGYYRDFMPALKQAHEDKIIQYPRDADVRRDVALVRRVNGIPKVPDIRTAESKKAESKRDGGKRHGDAAIALFLANNAARKAEEIWMRWEALTTM